MAEFYIRNSLNITKSVKFNMTLRYFVVKGSEGDHKWVLEIGTTYPDANGDPISPKIAHGISVDNLDDVIEGLLPDLCSQIDWSPFEDDKEAPYVDYVSPEDGNTDVSLYASVLLTLKDFLPSAGIDLSNMKVTLNNSMVDFDITSEVTITGDPYEYQLRWDPPLRVQNTYD